MSRRKKAAASPAVPQPPKRELFAYEGFWTSSMPCPSAYNTVQVLHAPQVSNGSTSVYRYRVTVERIEEPTDVIIGRMLALYIEEDSYRKRGMLCEEAKRFGVDLAEMARSSAAGGGS